MKNVGIELVNPQKGYVALPYTDEQLSQFIKSLLGTPQTISKKIEGVFVIQLSDIQSFNDLICQRVAQQNQSKLLEVKSTIYFSDKSNITLNSYDDLISYYEIKPLLSIGIRITWSFLINFPDKETPERQEIELFYCANKRKLLTNSDVSSESYFNIEIRHTQRTWGVDIENIIEDQIDSIKQKISKFRFFVKRNSSEIAFLLVMFILIIFFQGFYTAKNKYITTQKEGLYYYIDHNKDIGKKIDYTMKEIIINKKLENNYLDNIYIVLTIPILLAIGLWIKVMASRMPKSFLIFSRKSYDEYNDYKKVKNRDWIMFWISIIVSILAGIFSNYLYSFMINLFN